MNKEQKEKCIRLLIDNDIDQLYKRRDLADLLYYGCLPYKKMSIKEIKETFKDLELELPI